MGSAECRLRQSRLWLGCQIPNTVRLGGEKQWLVTVYIARMLSGTGYVSSRFLPEEYDLGR